MPKKQNSNQMNNKVSEEDQWPQTQNFINVNNDVAKLLDENPNVFVSEKLDGSNLSISSNGVIASRRKILLRDPSEENLKKTEFMHSTLISVLLIVHAMKALKKEFFGLLCLPNSDNFDVTIFGEWILQGTSHGKEDIFKYKERNIKTGHFYGFGLRLSLWDQCLDGNTLWKIQNNLRSKGFVMQNSDVLRKRKNETRKKDIVIFMNKSLKQLFDRHKIATVPVYPSMKLNEVFQKFCSELLEQKLEGFIITFPSKGIILKWKGCEDKDIRKLDYLADIKKKTRNPEALEPIQKVLQKSLGLVKYGESESREDEILTNALYSAQSKFPTIENIFTNNIDILNNGQIEKHIQDYRNNLIEEIIADVDGKRISAKDDVDKRITITNYVNKNVGPGKCLY